MKICELCKGAARVFCESDQASLCWSCDAKVHSANFLVARHVRSLLCHSCHSPTAWSGSGHKLGRTISICEPCVKARVPNNTESHGANEEDSESGIDYDTDEDFNQQDELLEENLKDGEDNQVVPLSSCSSETHRYRLDIDINVSPEGSDEYVADLKSKDDLESSSPRQMDTVAGSCTLGDEDSYIYSSSPRPFKFRKLEADRVGVAQNSSSCSRIGEALRRINHRIDRKILGGGGAVKHECFDLDLNECP
ncbi:B-box zinc finger protein 32 [Heracleum sosnowskyi]|uniref:B-box zinc finger protein 32 n=1 Tax=Heracleum sosnowskyi TaxID=360622 RepID=A0AAD8INC1_9APIA|nr:B-box zinc finger protein 32 [Heracleum sosnowskyi]